METGFQTSFPYIEPCLTSLNSSLSFHFFANASFEIDVFIVWITQSNEVFEFMRITIDVIIDGDKIDDTNEEVALDANIFQHKVIALIIAL